jgi:hypothetical protein
MGELRLGLAVYPTLRQNLDRAEVFNSKVVFPLSVATHGHIY